MRLPCASVTVVLGKMQRCRQDDRFSGAPCLPRLTDLPTDLICFILEECPCDDVVRAVFACKEMLAVWRARDGLRIRCMFERRGKEGWMNKEQLMACTRHETPAFRERVQQQNSRNDRLLKLVRSHSRKCDRAEVQRFVREGSDATAGLECACKKMKPDFVRSLLVAGARANARNDAALRAALRYNKPSGVVIEMLLRHGADPNAALPVIAKYEVSEKILETLFQHGMNKDLALEHGVHGSGFAGPTLMRAALCRGAHARESTLRAVVSVPHESWTTISSAKARVMLEHGADPRADHDEVMRLASLFGSLETMEVLLEFGADPNAGLRGSLTVIEQISGHRKLRLLLEHGADRTEALNMAIELNMLCAAHMLVVEKGTVATGALAQATETGTWNGLDWLLRHGADKDVALEHAAKHTKLHMVSRLLEMGADACAHDSNALRSAAKSQPSADNETIIEMLSQHGADVRANGDEALFSCVIWDKFASTGLLLEYGADPRVVGEGVTCLSENEQYMKAFLLRHAAFRDDRDRSLLARGVCPIAYERQLRARWQSEAKVAAEKDTALRIARSDENAEWIEIRSAMQNLQTCSENLAALTRSRESQEASLRFAVHHVEREQQRRAELDQWLALCEAGKNLHLCSDGAWPGQKEERERRRKELCEWLALCGAREDYMRSCNNGVWTLARSKELLEEHLRSTVLSQESERKREEELRADMNLKGRRYRSALQRRIAGEHESQQARRLADSTLWSLKAGMHETDSPP